MRFLFSIIALFIVLLAFPQHYDTIITNKAYVSYFNKSLKVPAVVKYKLYKGGGDCQRSKFRFCNDIEKLYTATDVDYYKSGYDRGHMANAKDFAYDCHLLDLTFRYYNCVPQTKELNRGPWNKYEKKLRRISQNDSLLIVIINIFDRKLLRNNVGIPSYCIKIAYSLTDCKPLLSFYIDNSKKPQIKFSDVINIEKKFNINLKSFATLN